jgi:hypothetical protein
MKNWWFTCGLLSAFKNHFLFMFNFVGINTLRGRRVAALLPQIRNPLCGYEMRGQAQFTLVSHPETKQPWAVRMYVGSGRDKRVDIVPDVVATPGEFYAETSMGEEVYRFETRDELLDYLESCIKE